MLHQYKIKGTQDVYTIGVHSCSLTGDLEFGLIIYDDMKQNGIDPDEVLLQALDLKMLIIHNCVYIFYILSSYCFIGHVT